jgi:hypothetical protein
LGARVSELDNLRFSYEALLRHKKLAAVLGKGIYIAYSWFSVSSQRTGSDGIF